jgi:hypothetical protein
MTSLLSWTTLIGIAPALRGGAMAIRRGIAPALRGGAMAMTALSVSALIGCGSQQLRLASPETTAGISYTCTSASACYPASVAGPVEGQESESIVLTLPRECGGRIHEIVVREPDSSSPEIDVTCARQESAPPAGGAGIALSQRP